MKKAGILQVGKAAPYQMETPAAITVLELPDCRTVPQSVKEEWIRQYVLKNALSGTVPTTASFRIFRAASRQNLPLILLIVAPAAKRLLEVFVDPNAPVELTGHAMRLAK